MRRTIPVSALRIPGFIMAGFSCLLLSLANAMPGADAAPETIEELPGLSLWEHTLNLRAGFGYKDNVLMSHIPREASAFFVSEAEVTSFRLPVDGHEFFLMAVAEDVRYFSGDEVDSEQMMVALAQYGKQLGGGWKPGASLRYVYLDQVLDVSVTETNQGSELVRGHSLRAAPYVRKVISRSSWLELEPAVSRQWLAAPFDDYWEPAVKLTFGKAYGNKSEATLSYEYSRRLYDEREPFTADRQPIPGENLEYGQQEVALRMRHNWDKARRWQTTTRLSFYVSQDNASGYFDFYRYQLLQQARYQVPKWELKAQVRLAYYDFPVQTVSATDSSLRHRTTATANIRGEWQVAKHWKLFAEFEHEQTWSNVTFDSYSVNTVSGGIDLGW